MKRMAIAGSVVAVAAVVAVFLLPSSETSSPQRQAPTQGKGPLPEAQGNADPSPADVAQVASATQGLVGLSAKVNELAASSRPEDASTAFHLLRQCKWAREEEHQFQMRPQAERDTGRASLVQAGVVGPKFIAQSCGDLQDADFRNMLALAERAAEAGVPMAALYLAAEGPWGDPYALYTRWDDPLVQEWRARMIRLTHLAANKGDVSALGSIQAQYETGEGLIAERNPELALQYAITKHIVHEALTGRKILGAKWELEQMTAAVAPEVAERARLAGERLAKQALGR